jgi:hypothetical protein
MTCLACGPRPLLQLFNSTPVSFSFGTLESQIHLVLLAYHPSALLLLPATPTPQVPCTPRLTHPPKLLAACQLRSHLSKAWDCIMVGAIGDPTMVGACCRSGLQRGLLEPS